MPAKAERTKRVTTEYRVVYRDFTNAAVVHPCGDLAEAQRLVAPMRINVEEQRLIAFIESREVSEWETLLP